MSDRRTGNIAQLPRAARDQVNRTLDDGCRYQEIITWLNSNGHPGIKPNNLTAWRKGGYQDWLQMHRELAREEKVLELSHKIATANQESKAHEAAIRVATNFLFRVFLKFDPEKLATALEVKPTQITAVLNAFSRISRRSNDLEMLKDLRRSGDRLIVFCRQTHHFSLGRQDFPGERCIFCLAKASFWYFIVPTQLNE